LRRIREAGSTKADERSVRKRESWREMEPTTQLTPPVLLCWTDRESGEELRILVQGPPEFLEELRAEGFRPAPPTRPGFETIASRAPCVVVASR
jgi:hypothetical protein